MGSLKKGQVYIHGYDIQEQERLARQSDFLKESIHEGLDFSNVRHLLEIGCGAGAQTKILLRNFPQLRITAIDISEPQIVAAQEFIKQYPGLIGRVTFSVGDAGIANFPAGSFDGAFICWVLEHAHKPQDIIRETKKCLKPGSPLVISEVYNSAFFLRPHSPSVENYWDTYNHLQTQMGGDPCIGMQLGSLLTDAGFCNIRLKVLYQHHDKQNGVKRNIMLGYFQQLLLSAKTNLLQEGMVDEQEIQSVMKEFEILKTHPDTIIFLMGMQAIGYA